MTYIYLACDSFGVHIKSLNNFPTRDHSVLVTFAAIDMFTDKQGNKTIQRNRVARTILDSGAFSAWNTGKTIDIDALIEETKDPYWTESVALDVIGDAKASVKNAMYMKQRGSPAFPVFHLGDPWKDLSLYKDNFPKIGLSCSFNRDRVENLRWLDQCFARAWPCRFHLFGRTTTPYLDRFPFDSADSTSWQLGPTRFQNWSGISKHNATSGMRMPSKSRNLGSSISAYCALQRRLEQLWHSELASIRGGNP